MVSRGEIMYTAAGVQQGVRADGRGLLDLRHIKLRTGNLPASNGSCLLRHVHGNTQLIVSVKAEVGACSPVAPDLGRVEVAVDCSSLSPGIAGGDGARTATRMGSELSRELQRVLLSDGALNLKDLCVIPGKACWILYVDATVIQADGGLLDLLSLAVLAALGNTRIPRVNIFETTATKGEGPAAAAESSGGAEQPQGEADFEVEPDPSAAKRLDVSGVPLLVTLSKVGNALVADLDSLEERCADVRLTVACNEQGRLCGVNTAGTGSFSPTQLHAAMRSSMELCGQLLGVVREELLAQEASKLALGPHTSFFERAVVGPGVASALI